MFDLSNLFSQPKGWDPTIKPADSAFAFGLDGKPTGLNAKTVGGAIGDFGNAIAKRDHVQGAFAQGQDTTSKDPTAAVAPSTDWAGMIANWRKHFNPGVA